MIFAIGLALLLCEAAAAQSRHSIKAADSEGTVLSVTAFRADKKNDPIKPENLYLYENGIEQKILSFSYDPSPSKIVILVDNSQTLPADVEKLKRAVMEFAYEIFEGDQLFVIAYDEKPEIIATFRKKGNPYLFDALSAAVREVLIPLMPGTRKTAIVVIGDGLDRGSKTPFDKILNELEADNIAVYSLQLPDRTGGAYRRDQPKAAKAINQLTEATGGRAFEFDDAQFAAKSICDELRRNRYLLSYSPLNTSSYDARRVFLVADDVLEAKNRISPCNWRDAYVGVGHGNLITRKRAKTLRRRRAGWLQG